jgi:hypothetical protein
VAFIDHYFYVATGNVLEVWDKMKPEAAYMIESFVFEDQIQSLYLSDNYLFLANGPGGVVIFDARQPWHPVKVGHFDMELPYSASKLVKIGNFIYLTIYPDNFSVRTHCLIIDMSNPSRPYQFGKIDSSIARMVVDGDYLYASNWFNGLEIYDVRQPQAPVLTGQHMVTNSISTNLRLYNGHVLLICDGTLQIIDIVDPHDPELRQVYANADRWIHELAVKGHHAFLLCSGNSAEKPGSMITIDLANPDLPAYTGECPIPGTVDYSSFLKLDLNIACTASDAGLTLLGITDPSNPVIIQRYTVGKSMDIVTDGYFLYVAAYDEGLQIIDASDSSDPVLTGLCNTPGKALAVEIYDNYCYVADGSSGLRIIDVSRPSAPIETGYYDTPGNARDVVVTGSFAYVADGEAGIQILDVSNPSSPQLVGNLKTPDSDYGVSWSENYLYVARGFGGMQVFDLSSPGFPEAVGLYQSDDLTKEAKSVKVSDGLAYITYGFSGIRIIAVNDPHAPLEVGYYETRGIVNGMDIQGNSLYLANGSEGLSVMDASNPDQLEAKDSYPNAYSAMAVIKNRNLIYVAAAENGIYILSDSKTSSQAEYLSMDFSMTCYPNPVSGQANISFELKEPSHVRLEIFNNLGQSISVLADEDKPAGTHLVSWNAADNPSGVYYYRMESNGARASGKMINKR